MLSFWETESFINYDIIIIGSGIIGLSTAISLKERSPESSVLVLERGIFPAGASTRNAGFACFGSLTELLSDLDKTGPDKTLAVIEKRIRGLRLLQQRLGNKALGYNEDGGFELIFEKEMPALEHIEKANELLKHIYPSGVYKNRPDLVDRFGFNPNQVKSVVHNPFEGNVHTGQMMKALLQLAMQKGVEIRTGAEVSAIEEDQEKMTVTVLESIRGILNLRASQVVICTNAFTKALVPDIDILPGRGQVILTKPIENLKWQGAFHFDEGFYYFRNVGNRVLFGGGRNLAFAAETSTVFEPNNQILQELERLLKDVILPDQPFEIEQNWSGIMGFSADKQPIIRRVSSKVCIGFACNGMGVSLASVVGEDVADLVLERS